MLFVIFFVFLLEFVIVIGIRSVFLFFEINWFLIFFFVVSGDVIFFILLIFLILLIIFWSWFFVFFFKVWFNVKMILIELLFFFVCFKMVFVFFEIVFVGSWVCFFWLVSFVKFGENKFKMMVSVNIIVVIVYLNLMIVFIL